MSGRVWSLGEYQQQQQHISLSQIVHLLVSSCKQLYTMALVGFVGRTGSSVRHVKRDRGTRLRFPAIP